MEGKTSPFQSAQGMVVDISWMLTKAHWPEPAGWGAQIYWFSGEQKMWIKYRRRCGSWMATAIETKCGDAKGGQWIGLCLWSLTPCQCSLALGKSQGASWLKWCSKCHPWFTPFISISVLGRERSQSCSDLWAPHKHWRGEIQVGRMLKAVVGGKFQNSSVGGQAAVLGEMSCCNFLLSSCGIWWAP